MKIHLASIFVDDQAKGLEFYTNTLGFEKKTDVPMGEFSWLTVVSPEAPDGVELVLEPANHPAVGPFRDALVADGIPLPPSPCRTCRPNTSGCWALAWSSPSRRRSWGPVTTAVFDDTCGNLIQIAAMAQTPGE